MSIYRNKAVAVTAALCAASLFMGRTPTVRADDMDHEYLKQATEEVLGDAAINRIARDKADNEEVRHYAADRVKVDEKLESELRDIADRHHAVLPGKDELSKAAQARLDHMKGSSHFDRDYLAGEMRDTGEMAKLFQSASEKEPDHEVRGFFADKSAILKDHQDKVKALDDKYDK